ncbi:MAG TPA: aldehyde dehydrogenase family protein [Streptosporangiaceae bacterium]|nr:aldehyde dehydrogenase family protein [Streptosporangiaceae bacterium]
MTAQELSYTSYIGGSWTPPAAGAEEIVSTNPYRPAETIATAQAAAPGDVARAVEAARRESRAWAGTDPAVRSARLLAFADALRDDGEALAVLLAREVGKPLAEARAEVSVAESVTRYYSAHLMMAEGETFPAPGPNLSYTQRGPAGVVAVITPFNFPLSIPVWKLVPALAYGCTVVWKPAPATVGLAGRIIAALERAGLAAAVSLVHGGGPVAGQLMDGGVDAVTFTGSTPAGQSVAMKCLQRGIRYQCEMGGVNATVVLRDADLEAAARGCAAAAFGYAGQKCTATRRLIVDRPVWDQFLAALAAVMADFTLGDPLDAGTAAGPLISRAQAALVRDKLAAYGPALVRRSAPAGDGYWSDLAVVGPVPPPAVPGLEEIFGPVAAAIAVDGLAEAISVTNTGPFGLAAAVYTRSLDSALAFAGQARAGLVRVNRTTTGLDYAVPFGGEGRSGLGPKELGTAAREFFTTSRTVWLGASG